jgi:hypothetical protein
MNQHRTYTWIHTHTYVYTYIPQTHDESTQVQLDALRKHGVEERMLAKTKTEASEMLRALREVRLGNGLAANNRCVHVYVCMYIYVRTYVIYMCVYMY